MNSRIKTRKIVYPAILGSLALVLLYIAGAVPSGSWGLVAAAGLLPCAAVISVGIAAGFLCWAGVTVLAFLLLPDKFIALLFGVLFGLYPVVKGLIERLRKLPLEYVLKLVFFNLSFTAVYLVMKVAVLAARPGQLHQVWVLYLVGNVVFLLYDYGFSKLIALYISRIHRHSR